MNTPIATGSTPDRATWTGPDASFVPLGVDFADWAVIEPLGRALLDRPVNNARELERWILDRGELDAACGEAAADLYITMTSRTEDHAAQQAYLRYIEEVQPKLRPLAFALDRRYVQLADRVEFDRSPASRWHVYDRDIRVDVELFREENVPLETELAKLSQRYDQLTGAQTVHFDGQERTLPQMARYQEVADRAVREAAWRAVAERRLRDADAIDDIFDQMVPLRDRIARNAGLPSYVRYAFRAKHRFDYGPHECEAFHDACERAVVPLVRRIEDQRRRAMNLDSLRPWDLNADPKGRPPLRPFEGGAQLMAKSVAAFRRLDPRLADMLASLGDGTEARGSERGACLDLDTRKGKAPGGYQYMRDRIRRPFIFMNAAGLSRDVTTMLHEAGHAFHSMLCATEPLLAYRSAPTEFAEVASMSMELLTLPHVGGPGGFYDTDETHARAARQQLERTVTILPWIATIDAFQHWIYTHPRHSRADRTRAWLALDDRFGSRVDWSGLEPTRDTLWHRQLHLFTHPLYYIEYGIAQLGALQLWLLSLRHGERRAVDGYIRALSLGGSRPLPELFAAAGLDFDFSADTVRRLTDRVEAELERLPL